jgi:UDP-glucose 4-epimerase
MMIRNVLVTGGAGFVGSHLCAALVASQKYNVISLDNYSTGSISNHVAGVTYLDDSTDNIFNYQELNPEKVYHLGEYSRVEQSYNEPEKVWHYNCHGTHKVVEYCRQLNSKLIYAGSSTKFGDNGAGRNQSPYGWTKSVNTDLINNYIKWYALNAVIVYFYNVYGPREIEDGDYATVVGIFTRKMKNGEKLQVVSPGTQTRNFTHIDDIISGILLAGDQGAGDGYGIGNASAYTIIELAELFGGEIEFIDPRRGNRMGATLMTDKLVALGWSANNDLKKYIDRLQKNNWVK